MAACTNCGGSYPDPESYRDHLPCESELQRERAARQAAERERDWHKQQESDRAEELASMIEAYRAEKERATAADARTDALAEALHAQIGRRSKHNDTCSCNDCRGLDALEAHRKARGA